MLKRLLQTLIRVVIGLLPTIVYAYLQEISV